MEFKWGWFNHISLLSLLKFEALFYQLVSVYSYKFMLNMLGCVWQTCKSEAIGSVLGTFYQQHRSVPEVSPLLKCSLLIFQLQQMLRESGGQVLYYSRL